MAAEVLELLVFSVDLAASSNIDEESDKDGNPATKLAT
jgi:hypothetical protein